MKIPKSFRLFASEISVVFDDDRMNDLSSYGLSEYGENKITLSTKQGRKTLNEGQVLDTFYHEKIHMILDSMGKNDLSSNEEFVEIFAKLLRQSDETAIY